VIDIGTLAARVQAIAGRPRAPAQPRPRLSVMSFSCARPAAQVRPG
jgi:hypothetical protein